MMMRIAAEKRLPFEPLVPNAETVAAMEAARRGELVMVGDVDGLMTDLHEDDYPKSTLHRWRQQVPVEERPVVSDCRQPGQLAHRDAKIGASRRDVKAKNDGVERRIGQGNG